MNYKCKICDKEIKINKYLFICKDCGYRLDIVRSDDAFFVLEETYSLSNISIEILYLSSIFIINNKKCNFINFNDYKSKDVHNTFSFNTVKLIIEKYNKYKNIQ